MVNLAPSDVAIVRAGSRIWLVTPGVLSPDLRFTSARQWPLGARRLNGAADRHNIRRLYARLQTTTDASRRSDEEIAVWLDQGLARGRLSAFDVTPDMEDEPAVLPRRQTLTLTAPGGLVTGLALPRPTLDNLSDAAVRQRCTEVLLRCHDHMDDETRRTFDDFLVPVSLEAATAALAHWAGVLGESLRPAFDARLFAKAWDLSGWNAFDGLDALARCARITAGGLDDTEIDDEQIDEAGRQLALAIGALGVAPFFLLTAREALEEAPVQGNFEAAVLRWASFIETIEITALDARSGAIWGSLGPRGQLTAESLAQRQGRITMAKVLAQSGFIDRYRAEFDAAANTPLSRRVWDMVSRHYASALSGRVTLYVEAEPLLLAGGGAPLDAWLSHPSLRSQLTSLAAMLGPAVFEVEIADVGLGNISVLAPTVRLRG